MKLEPILSVWLVSLAHLVVADTEPVLSYDIHTIQGCSYWYDNDGDRTCESIRDAWQVSPATFSRWNPSISLDCKGWGKHSYCVAVKAEMTSSSTTTPSSTSSTISTTSRAPPPLWTDRGCYKDASIHPFQTQLPFPGGNGLTRLDCEDTCWTADFPYVGFRAGVECWCGKYVQGHLSPSPTDCNVPCAGNASETCGGKDAFNVVEGNEAPYSHTTTQTLATSSATSSAAPSASLSLLPILPIVAFQFISHYNGDCTGETNNAVTVQSNTDGMCVNTNCQVASLDIANAGNCPSGQVQISYWQNADCSGEWYGYSYASRDTCRALWSDGLSFKSLWVRCMDKSQDCVHKGSCKPDAEPMKGICSGEHDALAFQAKCHYHADCTGDIHSNITIQSNTDGMCIDTNCQVASLEVASAGHCSNGQVQISYWQQPGCSGKWYGYGYTSRDTCRSLWSAGWKFKSFWLRCAEQGKDCVNQRTCVPDAEPTSNVC